jgi:glycosyltransferase involved in cell wall biosynthesis
MSLVTVGLPVYNAMPFLPETINSILAQSYPHFKVLAIDDGSTDESWDYLKSVDDPRFRVISQSNQGLTNTLNRMLKEVDTPWLIRHDADDIAYPNRIKLIIEYINNYPDAGMFYSYASYYQSNKSFGTFRTTKALPEVICNLTRAGYLLAICHPTVTLNVKKTIDLGGYRFNLHIEDIDLWWRMALAHKIRLIPEVTVGFRLNSNSASSSNLEAQAINVLYVQYLLLAHLWSLNPLPYEVVKDKLCLFINSKKLNFRANMRRANICMGNKHYLEVFKYIFNAFLSSPKDFFERSIYEFKNKDIAVNGENPKLFAYHCNALWLEQINSSNLAV